MTATATPTAVSPSEETSTPDSAVTDASGEASSSEPSPSSDSLSTEATAPVDALSDQSELGNGSWLFFGGVGLLLVGVVLLLVWRRQG
jgi:cobalamin biosynthesis Mg chelatase CobN